MDKRALIELIAEAMEADFDAAFQAARNAAAYATDEQARAETKWDTQGLEASYFAAGKAGQAHGVAASIALLRKFEPEPCEVVALGALVKCKMGGLEEVFFISPVGGGKEVTLEKTAVTVITLESPLGQALLDKGTGDSFTLANGNAGKIVWCA